MPAKSLTKSALLHCIADQTEADRKTAGLFLETRTGIVLAAIKKVGK